MVGRTELIDHARGRRAVLEYPIVYMNVHPPQNRFQVDVGPILFPDLESKEESSIQRLQLAYVMYNQLDKAEFAIRVPTRVTEGQTAVTLHYSKVVKMAAESELFSLKIQQQSPTVSQVPLVSMSESRKVAATPRGSRGPRRNPTPFQGRCLFGIEGTHGG